MSSYYITVLLDERVVKSMEKIADALERAYPVRKEKGSAVAEAVVTHVPTEEDRIRENQGASTEPIEEWMGLREKEIVNREKDHSK